MTRSILAYHQTAYKERERIKRELFSEWKLKTPTHLNVIRIQVEETTEVELKTDHLIC